MENDDYMCQVDVEVNKLQCQLKTRLQETQDLSDLNKKVMEQSFKLDETTLDLKATAKKTKWKWLYEYGKWLAILGIILILLFMWVFGSFIPNMKSQDTSSSDPESKKGNTTKRT